MGSPPPVPRAWCGSTKSAKTRSASACRCSALPATTSSTNPTSARPARLWSRTFTAPSRTSTCRAKRTRRQLRPRRVADSRGYRSRLAGGRQGAAGNQLHDTVLRRDGDHVGDITPRTIEQAGRDVILLPHGADLAAILAAHVPDDLDVLLTRFWFGDDDGSTKDEVCLSLW